MGNNRYFFLPASLKNSPLTPTGQFYDGVCKWTSKIQGVNDTQYHSITCFKPINKPIVELFRYILIVPADEISKLIVLLLIYIVVLEYNLYVKKVLCIYGYQNKFCPQNKRLSTYRSSKTETNETKEFITVHKLQDTQNLGSILYAESILKFSTRPHPVYFTIAIITFFSEKK